MKFLVAVLFLTIALATSEARKIVCYYQSWAIYNSGDNEIYPEDLDPTLCTHVNYAFMQLNSDGSLSSEDEWADLEQGLYNRVVAMKEKNPNLKVLLSIGPSGNYASIAADPEKRAAMVDSTRWFIEHYGFDGADIDWEYPGNGDRGNYISLLEEFRNDFDRNGWELSAAVAADVTDGYDAPRISELLDHINVMTYDMYGPWSEYTGQNSPLWAAEVETEWERDHLNMDAAIRLWIDAGANPAKLCAGIAFYGHSFALSDPSDNWLHAPITGPGRGGNIVGEEGSWTYLEFCTVSSWHRTWDAEQRMLICVDGSLWLGIDDEGSIRNKVAYINRNGLGGAMIWSIDQDDVKGKCGDPMPLLRAIADNIN